MGREGRMTRKTVSRIMLVLAYIVLVAVFVLVWRWSEAVS